MIFTQPMKLNPQSEGDCSSRYESTKNTSFNPYLIDVWNCHFEKIAEVDRGVLNFLCEKEINTAAQRYF